MRTFQYEVDVSFQISGMMGSEYVAISYYQIHNLPRRSVFSEIVAVRRACMRRLRLIVRQYEVDVLSEIVASRRVFMRYSHPRICTYESELRKMLARAMRLGFRCAWLLLDVIYTSKLDLSHDYLYCVLWSLLY